MSHALLTVAPEVARALDDGAPIVALESTLITHGLPHPDNVAAARAAEAAVRSGGAIPATVALHDGRILVGLDETQLEHLGRAPGLPKVSRQNLASVLGAGGWAGTTVSATMIAAHLAGIEVFATGGIGGVHRGGEDTLDVSADLEELARTPVSVVCAGPKSILDVPRTLEALETRGVPVVGWGTDEVPGFFARHSGHRAPSRVDDAREAARLVRRQQALGLDGGLLFCVPIPEAAAIPREEMEAVIDRAVRETEAAGIHGPAATPAVLSRIAALTEGRSVVANLALIEHDAEVAASLAVALAT
ncbi:MAG: pseudouridine-5'-phosphate glycosidase [Candidatus Limnocylindrales bacterium]